MKVQEAIKAIEAHGNHKFLWQRKLWNEDQERLTMHYAFDHCIFDCIGQLRYYGAAAKYTMGL